MTPQEARNILHTIASNPAALATQFALFSALDAVAALYVDAATDAMPQLQRALHSPRATWAAVHVHAENRMGPAT